MNETMTLWILATFDAVIFVFGVYLLFAGLKMQKTKEIDTMLLAEDEVKRCKNKEELAKFFCWREEVMGVIFVLFGAIRLLDKFLLKIGGILDVILMIVLLVTVLWVFKSLQTARASFLTEE